MYSKLRGTSQIRFAMSGGGPLKTHSLADIRKSRITNRILHSIRKKNLQHLIRWDKIKLKQSDAIFLAEIWIKNSFLQFNPIYTGVC